MREPSFIEEDLTFDMDAECTLAVLSAACAAHKQTAPFTLEDPRETVGGWIASGMKGAPSPWSDPVAQTLVGLEGVLHDGTRIALRPCPRRAAGPDLRALFVGQQARMGRLMRVWLYVGPRKVDTPATNELAQGSPISSGERDLRARISAHFSPRLEPPRGCP